MPPRLPLLLALSFLAAAPCLPADPPPPSHADAFTKDGLIKADVAQLKDTQILLHPDTPIPPDTNLLWCGTFQLAWNEAIKLVGEKLQFENQPPIVGLLNRQDFTANDLDPASYVALADFERNHVEAEIRAALQKTFHGAASPELIPPIPPHPGPDDFVAYAYLFKNLAFDYPFTQIPDYGYFCATPESTVAYVKAFTLPKSTEKHFTDAIKQVTIFDYQSQDDFVIKLKTRAQGDELILAKVTPCTTLSATIDSVLKRIATGKRENTGPRDVLIIPELNYDLRKDFSELEGLVLTPGPSAKIKSKLVLAKAEQLVRFQLNEKGAVLKSEAVMVMGPGAAPLRIDWHIMIFNKPFLILMKRADSPQPYFAMWVGNASLLIPAK
jgi:hypothetical protein